MAAPRRRKMIGQKRRVEDEEGGPDQLDLDDDSLTEGSIASDDNDHEVDSDTSNIDEISPVAPTSRKSNKSAGNGAAKTGAPRSSQSSTDPAAKAVTDTQRMLQGMSINEEAADSRVTEYGEAAASAEAPKPASNGPLVVSSDSAPRPPSQTPGDRRRREHEEYKRRRDEDPAFVPNRGAFFMHDHRHAGPAANGFRPFGRGRGKGGRGGIGGPFTPVSQFAPPADPLASGQWSHDMHEAVADPFPPPRQAPAGPDDEGPPNGNGFIPTCPPNSTPINRTMSAEKHLGTVQVRVYLPGVGKDPIVFGMPAKQYTKLPDHRPPLRRDKPVRISLPDNPPKYIFPAIDRSFIFIPRALRPNQQRGRGKPRAGMGSFGSFSRRASVFGGSFYGSTYSPSIALSRRSSLAPDGRDYMFSPTGSVVSRPPMPAENPRPVVRLPPAAQHPQLPQLGPQVPPPLELPQQQTEVSISDLPAPQTHPLPQKPAFQENRPQPIPMHQPRPQKTVSVADIDSPYLNQQPFQQAFHQQVPLPVSNGLGQEGHAHSRQASYPSQHSTGTPLSQIPERAIHAAPFQPTPYKQSQQQSQQRRQQQQGYYGQPHGMMPSQQGYYHPPYNGGTMGPSPGSAPFVPAPPAQGQSYPQQTQSDQQSGQPHAQSGTPNMVAQEVNGMVYYYDASQMPPVNYTGGYQGAPQGYGSGVPGMGGMVTPSPDGFFYPQQAPGMVYYPQ